MSSEIKADERTIEIVLPSGKRVKARSGQIVRSGTCHQAGFFQLGDMLIIACVGAAKTRFYAAENTGKKEEFWLAKLGEEQILPQEEDPVITSSNASRRVFLTGPEGNIRIDTALLSAMIQATVNA